MDALELEKEQLKLAPKIVLRDGFTSVKTLAGIDTFPLGNNKLLASVVVCEFPSLKLIEHQTYLLHDPLPYKPGFSAYREMPAMIEAYNKLDQDPDVILVKGEGILHPRKIGIAAHLGLILNKPTIGVSRSLLLGRIEKGKIIYHNEIVGFEITTRQHANPVYVTPGHLISLGSVLLLISKAVVYPHKIPEPLHLAHKLAKRCIKEKLVSINLRS
ncbi:endonuclease V [Candidatus Woesearchaeota archaeon]|nr:endonuclease V [Candidatus Woesearchaeota archaeon]